MTTSVNRSKIFIKQSHLYKEYVLQNSAPAAYREELNKSWIRKKKIGFIGLGLIGGSIAKAIRQYYPDYTITAFDKNKETLALATQESVIDVAATHIDDSFRG